MAKSPEPFFVSARNIWRVRIDDKQYNLGPDEDAAWQRYYELMAARPKPQPKTAEGLGVVALLERFMEHVQRSRSARTYDFYKAVLKSFRLSLPQQALTVQDLAPAHVTDWIAAHPGWSPSTQHGAIHAVKRTVRAD